MGQSGNTHLSEADTDMLFDRMMLASNQVEKDPYWNNVSLLCNFDGINGSTTITDKSRTPIPLTANNGAAITTSRCKFGTGSLVVDGTNDTVTATSQANLRLDADFTIECFVYLPTTQVRNYPCVVNIGARYNAGNNIIVYCCHTGNPNKYLIYINSILVVTGTIAPTKNEWHHFALVRSGSTVTAYVNGISCGSGTKTGAIYAANPNFCVGSEDSVQLLSMFTGNVDSLRITNLVARYTSNFTPPNKEFPTS